MLDSGGKQTLTPPPPVPPLPSPHHLLPPSPRAKTSHITAQNVHAGEKKKLHEKSKKKNKEVSR